MRLESVAVLAQRGNPRLESGLINPQVAAVGQHAEALIEQLLAVGDIAGHEAWNFAMPAASGQDCR